MRMSNSYRDAYRSELRSIDQEISQEPEGDEMTTVLPNYVGDRTYTDWSLIPEGMRGGLRRYIENGIVPGHFLRAVLTNDLRTAVERADDQNVKILGDYIKFLYCYTPSQCWGSNEKFNAWVRKGGMGATEVAA